MQRIIVAVVVSSLLWTSSAIAEQQHVVEVADMRQAIDAQAATDQQNRDVLLSAMQRPEVRELANKLGLNLTRAESAVATLDSVALADMAAPLVAPDINRAGGASVIVISLTTLLLVIIIVILLVK